MKWLSKFKKRCLTKSAEGKSRWVTDPLPMLRSKWGRVPSGDLGRASTQELLSLSDAELIEYWRRARASSCSGSNFSVRGWYQTIYSPMMDGKKVLDVGCGLAFDSITFAEHGAHVTFVDIVESNLHLLRRVCKLLNLQGVEYLYLETMDLLRNLPVDYDVIMAMGSLHHAPESVIIPEVQELLRHLNVGGRWLQLAYPKARWEREGSLPFEAWGVVTDGEGTPWAEWYDANKLLKIMAPAQFDVVLSHEFNNSDFIWFDLLKRQ